jgi:hypothetical protein
MTYEVMNKIIILFLKQIKYTNKDNEYIAPWVMHSINKDKINSS